MNRTKKTTASERPASDVRARDLAELLAPMRSHGGIYLVAADAVAECFEVQGRVERLGNHVMCMASKLGAYLERHDKTAARLATVRAKRTNKGKERTK